MSDIEPTKSATESHLPHRELTKDRSTIEPVRPEREGLPRGYRMRADTHYVDHIGSQSSGQPVRMVDVDQIASSPNPEGVDLRPLIESIRAHGIVHPLLIARRDAAYVVVAGAKRLAAARVLRLPAVPCLVHTVDQSQATLLARADNLQVGNHARVESSTSSMATEVSQAVAQHLSVVHTTIALIRTSRPQLARAAVDLVAAHSWRAARLVETLEAVDKPTVRPSRMRSVAAVVDRVVDGFGSEARLTGIEIRSRLDGAAAGAIVDDHAMSIVVSSAVLAMLPIVDEADADRPQILVAVSSGAAGWLHVSITQSAATTPPGLAGRFFDDTYSERVGGWCAAACARAIRSVTERAGGTASFEIDSRGHSSLTVQWPCA